MRRKSIQAKNVHLVDKSIKFPDGIGGFDCLPEFDRLGSPDRNDLHAKLEERLDQFRTAYEEARRIIDDRFGSKFKLAYRLNLVTRDLPEDDIYASKIGGLPDLCATEWTGKYRDKTGKNLNFPTIDEFVADHWPRCPVCLRPMRFLAQINIWDWIVVLHQLTGQVIRKGIPRCPGWESRQSAMGYGSPMLLKHGLGGLARRHLMIWHCVSSCCSFGLHPRAQCHWSYNGLAAVNSKRMTDKKLRELGLKAGTGPDTQFPTLSFAVDLFGDNYPWTMAEYCQAADRFIAGETSLRIYAEKQPRTSRTIEHSPSDEHSYPLILEPKAIDDAKIGFDPADIPDYEAPDHPLFQSESNFVLFGAGQSQQEPLSPFCPNSFRGPHRMAPVIAYDEPGVDLTHQIYSCLMCGSGPYLQYDSTPFPGILDSSCT